MDTKKAAALYRALSVKYKYRQTACVLDEELLTKHKGFQMNTHAHSQWNMQMNS